MQMSKDFTGVVQGFSGKMMLLVRFQDGCNKDMTPNQLTRVTLDEIPVTGEAEFPTIYSILDEKVDLEKGYYHGVYILINFNNWGGVDRKEDQKYVKSDTDQYDMEGTIIDNEIECLWRIFFKDNQGGLDYQKTILHPNMWGLYINQKQF